MLIDFSVSDVGERHSEAHQPESVPLPDGQCFTHFVAWRAGEESPKIAGSCYRVIVFPRSSS